MEPGLIGGRMVVGTKIVNKQTRSHKEKEMWGNITLMA